MNKILFFFFISIFPLLTLAQPNIASPENVLVVYNNLNSVSQNIASYYQISRNIPDENMVGLSIPNIWDQSGHRIRLVDNNEVVVDLDGNNDNDKYSVYNNSMQYVKLNITQPIENYLNNTLINGETLANKIRFIVVCKGIPFKVTSWLQDFSHVNDITRRAVSIDALISIINQSDPNFSITDTPFINSGFSDSDYNNPYYNIEASDGDNYSFAYRFTTKTFINNSGLELNYLVSRLDGYDYNDVISMINKGINPDMSGTAKFVLDGDLTSSTGFNVSQCRSDVSQANQKLIGLNFMTDENESDQVIINTSGNCMAYQSSGLHSDPLLSYDYCVDVLEFNYSNGALFNTYESFNGFAFDLNNLGESTPASYGKRQGPGQGLIADFIHAGGTGGEAHVFEPTFYTIMQGNITYPAYAMGYSLVEAIYMGLPKLAFRNLVIGDPLTAIAWGKQTLTANTTWSSTNLVTGQITVPSGKTLTIASNAVINFKYNGSLLVDGTLNIQSGAELNFTNGASLIVNGNLSAQSTLPNKITFDFGSPNYSTQNGIKVNLNGTVSISNSTIKNAYNGLKIVASTYQSTIENSTIQNCVDGINIEYGSKDADLTISGNTINNNSNSGIYINNPGYGTNVEPVISNNTITGNTSGMGIYLNNTMLTVSNNTISSCEYGIYTFDDNSIYNSNIIHDNIDEGIFFSGGKPYLFNNRIYHNVDAEGIGVYASSSSPQFGSRSHSGMGNNVISNNSVGIKAENYSHPFLGTYDNANEYSLGGYNSIYTDGGGLVTSAYHSQVDAEYTYWGLNPHNFYQDGTSSIDTNNALSSDPNSTINPNIISTAFASAVQTSTSANIVQSNADILASSNTSSVSGAQPIFTQSFDSTAKTWGKQHLLLFAGSTLRFQHHYKDAAKIYKKIISLNPDKKWAVFALKNLQETYYESKRDTVPNEILPGNDLINYCKGITDSSSNESLKTISYLIMGEESIYEGKIKNAIEYYNSLNKLNTSESKLLSTWHLFNIYHSIYKDSVLEAKSVEYMKSNFPDNHLTKLAANLFKPGSKIINSKKSSAKMSISATMKKESIPLKHNLSQNYPNPFNPSTTIQYTLNAPSYVSLKVYNALGQEVAVLADGIQNEGYHSVIFTGDHLSSGVYLYRLSVKSNSGAVMFNSVKKMLYLK